LTRDFSRHGAMCKLTVNVTIVLLEVVAVLL